MYTPSLIRHLDCAARLPSINKARSRISSNSHENAPRFMFLGKSCAIDIPVERQTVRRAPVMSGNYERSTGYKFYERFLRLLRNLGTRPCRLPVSPLYAYLSISFFRFLPLSLSLSVRVYLPLDFTHQRRHRRTTPRGPRGPAPSPISLDFAGSSGSRVSDDSRNSSRRP